jgi:hypothetical protein
MLINTKLLLTIAAAVITLAAGVHFYCAQQVAREAQAALQRHEATVKQPPVPKWAATIKNY